MTELDKQGIVQAQLAARAVLPYGNPSGKQVDRAVEAAIEAYLSERSQSPRTVDFWLSEDRALALEAALKRVMRNQAAMLAAWADGERYDEDSEICGELAASREVAKTALRYPQPRFSERPGDALKETER